MNLQSLKYFIKVADLKSYSRAALEYQTSQPTISKHVHDLEQEWNCDLFVRRGNNLVLTPSGEILYQYASETLSALKAANAEIHDGIGSLDYDLVISFRTVPMLMSSIIAGFHNQYNDIRIQSRQYEGNIGYASDAIVLPSRVPVENPYTRQLAKERILLAVSKAHPLAKRKSVSVSELEGERYIRRPDNSEIEQIVAPALQSLAFVPKSSTVIEHPPFINAMIAANLGIAFLPELNFPAEMHASIALLTIKEFDFTHYINITWKKDYYPSRAVMLFASYCEEFFRNIVKV